MAAAISLPLNTWIMSLEADEDAEGGEVTVEIEEEATVEKEEVTAEKGKRGSDYLTGSRSREITAGYYQEVTP